MIQLSRSSRKCKLKSCWDFFSTQIEWLWLENNKCWRAWGCGALTYGWYGSANWSSHCEKSVCKLFKILITEMPYHPVTPLWAALVNTVKITSKAPNCFTGALSNETRHFFMGVHWTKESPMLVIVHCLPHIFYLSVVIAGSSLFFCGQRTNKRLLEFFCLTFWPHHKL